VIDSPFRQPHQRQEALRRLLQTSRDQGDQRAVGLLEMQWVHRYGVDSLPALSLAAAPIVSVSTSPVDSVVPAAPEAEPVEPAKTAPAPMEEIPSTVHRFRTLLRDGLDAVSATVDQERGDLAPPPSPSLKRLRRWLPSAATDLPKAS